MTRLKFAAGAALSLSVAASAGVAAAATAHHPSSVTTVSSHRKSTSRPAAHRRHYRVQAGDSWWSIAHQFNIDWNNLAHDNGMQLSSMLHPGMVLVLPRRAEKAVATTSATPSTPAPTPPAAGSTDTSAAPQSSFEQCVIARESGGNAEITNGAGYWGLFQFSASTWAAYGGNPADFGSASAAEQEQVFNDAIAQGGASNWAPYDGC